jgi:hypothetical protein
MQAYLVMVAGLAELAGLAVLISLSWLASPSWLAFLDELGGLARADMADLSRWAAQAGLVGQDIWAGRSSRLIWIAKLNGVHSSLGISDGPSGRNRLVVQAG